VDHHGGLAIRVPAGLPVHVVAVADIEQPCVIRFDRGIQLGHPATLRERLIIEPRPQTLMMLPLVFRSIVRTIRNISGRIRL